MNGTLNNAVKTRLLDWQIADPFWGGVYLCLGTADFTPDPSSVLADFVEATFSGYLRGLLAADWSAGVLMPDAVALTATDEVTFTNSGGAASPLIYTYFFFHPPTSQIVLGGRFDLPFQIPAAGSRTFTPFLSLTGL